MRRGLAIALLPGAMVQAQPCAGPGPQPERLAPGVWWLAGESGDSTAENHGAVVHLLAVRQGRRLWLVGAGPSPRVGAAVACRLRQVSGLSVTDLVVPWPRAELTLGASAFAGARRWAHADVAAAMRQRCSRCTERMRERLGAAEAELGSQPVRLPDHLLRGEHGRLGPFAWWRERRSADTSTLLLQLPGLKLWTGHGLVWGDGPPDLRDADAAVMREALQALSQRLPPGAIVLPEQGPIADRVAVQAQGRYLQALDQRIRQAQAAGTLETEVATALPDVPAPLVAHWRHGLNWQRRWLQLEAAP